MAAAEFSPASQTLDTPGPTSSEQGWLDPGERVLAEAAGVRLGWRWQTVLIWWLPGIVFIALGQLEFRSVPVTLGLLGFCAVLFLFYASDREVRPRGGSRRYLLTDRRLRIGNGAAWRDVPLSEVAATHMESGPADLMVARLSGAATIVLELRQPGPKGEPRRLRIGPLRRPRDFRAAVDALLPATRDEAHR